MHKRNHRFALALAALAGTCSIHAQSADALLDKLVDKGVLTVEEANELREQSDKGFDTAYQVKSGLPDWVTSLRIGGDFRGRYDMITSDEPTYVDRHRFRYRIRPGIVATLQDNFEVGFRLTSAEANALGGDTISGNVTFQDNASKKHVFIDLAYGKWTAVNNSLWSATLSFGKIENPLVVSDLVFDPDYTPEGAGQQLSFNLSEDHKLQLNFAELALEEISTSSRDTFLFGAQSRLESAWTPHLSSSVGITALAITSEQNLAEPPGAAPAVPNINRGNRRTAAGVLANNFNPWVVDGAVGYSLESFPTYNAPFPIRLTAEYMNNPAADEMNEAYAFGITFGKAGKRGLWEAGYRWKHLQADAWYEELVDSDFGGLQPAAPGGRATYAPGTNVQGHIFKAAYSPYNSITIGVTYFLAEIVAGTPAGYDESVGRLQLDAVWKF